MATSSQNQDLISRGWRRAAETPGQRDVPLSAFPSRKYLLRILLVRTVVEADGGDAEWRSVGTANCWPGDLQYKERTPTKITCDCYTFEIDRMPYFSTFETTVK